MSKVSHTLKSRIKRRRAEVDMMKERRGQVEKTTTDCPMSKNEKNQPERKVVVITPMLY